MVPALIGLAYELAPLVPMVAGLLSGSNPEDKAGQIVNIAKGLTGQADPEAAVAALKNSPELQVRLKEALLQNELDLAKEDTKRLRFINQTMQKESNSRYWLPRSWRPIYGLVVAASFGCLTIGSIIMGFAAIWKDPVQAIEVIRALSGLILAISAIYGVALTVLGVQVKARSQDKAAATGAPIVPGIISALAQRILPTSAPADDALDEKIMPETETPPPRRRGRDG